jgi:hypothetical protein
MRIPKIFHFETLFLRIKRNKTGKIFTYEKPWRADALWGNYCKNYSLFKKNRDTVSNNRVVKQLWFPEQAQLYSV